MTRTLFSRSFKLIFKRILAYICIALLLVPATPLILAPETAMASPNTQNFAAGGAHFLAINSSGRLVASGAKHSMSGENWDVLIDYGSTLTRVSEARNWRFVTAGVSHSLAINSSGHLYAWGANAFGQLGDGTNTDRRAPRRIGSADNWIAASAGQTHSLAVNSEGHLYVWGNKDTSLGNDGSLDYGNAPSRIGGNNFWVTISAGEWHSVAIDSNGRLYHWGNGERMSLGGANVIESPTQVNTESFWRDVSAGGGYTLAIDIDGYLYGWGCNAWGQSNPYIDDMGYVIAPTRISSESNWVSINAGHVRSYAANSAGHIVTWGWNIPAGYRNWNGESHRIGKVHIPRTDSNWAGVAPGWSSLFISNSGQLHTLEVSESITSSSLLIRTGPDPFPFRGFVLPSSTLIPITTPTQPNSRALPALVFISGTGNTQHGRRYDFATGRDESFRNTVTRSPDSVFDTLWGYSKGNIRGVGRMYMIPSAPNQRRANMNDPTMNSLGSLTHNAQSIRNFLRILADEEGITDVILIGYSKGGIDIREYLDGGWYEAQQRRAERGDGNPINVLGVIQLGTPNAGTPAASAQIARARGGFNINFSDADRAMQLDVAMAWNQDTRNTSNTTYFGIGGDYFYSQSDFHKSLDPAWSLVRNRTNNAERFIRNTLGLNDFPNDGTVPLWSFRSGPHWGSYRPSVFSVKHSYTAWHGDGIVHPQNAFARGATVRGEHGIAVGGRSEFNRGDEVRRRFADYVDRLRRSQVATQPRAQSATQSFQLDVEHEVDIETPLSYKALFEEVSLSTGIEFSRNIALAGESAVITISDAEDVCVSLSASDGTEIELDELGGVWAAYDLDANIYILEISSNSAKDIIVTVTDMSEWGMRFDAPIDGRAGQQITVSASFEEMGSDNIGQIESASVSLDGQAPASLSVNNGIATGQITLPDTSELSMITGTATGTTSDGVEITRVFGHQIAIAPAAASLRGDASISAQIGDSNAYESVDVSIGITGSQDANLIVRADIVDSAGVLVAQPSAEVEVSAGFGEEVTLSADSQMVWQNMSADGALTVSEVRVFYLHDDFTKLIDSAEDVATSAPVSRADFAASGISITPLEDELFAGTVDFAGTAFTTAGNLTGVEVSFSGGDSWYSASLEAGSDTDSRNWSFAALLDEGTFGMHARPVIDGSPVESPRLWASTVFEVVEKQQLPDPTFHTITFNSQGGSAAESLTIEDGQEIGTLPTTAKQGYTFLGWFDAPSAGNQITIATLATGSVTYYAQWQRIVPTEHTVVFSTHGGTPTPANRQIQQGSPMGALPTVTRANHTFAGWWTAQSGGTQITATTPVNANMTVHARWAPILPTRVTIGNAQSSTPLLVGRNRQLSANVTPTTALNRNVTWTSSNTRVATINANGRVTARAPGTTTIRVRTAAGDQTATATIRVQAAPAAINSSVRNITLRQNTNFRLPVVVRGNTNTNVTVNWRTNNRNVATLSNNRTNGSLTIRQNANRDLVIRAGRPGTARIRLTTLNNRTITYNIRVVRNTNRLTQVRIGNLPRNNTMNVGANRNLTTRLTPARATLTGNIRWSSSNRRVATVNNAGRVTAHRRGETTITMRVSGQVHRVVIRVR